MSEQSAAKIHLGDSLEVMKHIRANSVDLILTDLPYGVLNPRNKWDKVPDLELMWKQFRRVAKPEAAVISTAKQPFTTRLIASNLKDFRYTLVWEKSKATGYLNVKKMPLVAHEDIVVFYRKVPAYNPQMVNGAPYNKGAAVRDTSCYGKQTKAIEVKNTAGNRYPRSVQYFGTAEREGKLHPTQKPVALMDWLVKTYSNKGSTVLDPFMGSGTTGVAALRNRRNFVGIEADKKYFDVADARLQKTALALQNNLLQSAIDWESNNASDGRLTEPAL